MIQQPKWKTRDGKIINVSDMTDLHIQNSINYLRKQKNLDCQSMSVLSFEVDRREKRKIKQFLSQTLPCKECGKGICRILKYKEDETMFVTNYVFECNTCSYRSKLVDPPSRIFINPPTHKECFDIASFAQHFTQDEDFYEQNH